MNNKHGVDTWYFKRELEKLTRDIGNYTSAELQRYFQSLAKVAEQQKKGKDKEHTMCDCIKKLEEKFIEKFGAECEPQVEVVFTLTSNEVDRFIPINVSLYEKKRNGSLKSKKTTLATRGSFCPLCGEKLEA